MLSWASSRRPGSTLCCALTATGDPRYRPSVTRVAYGSHDGRGCSITIGAETNIQDLTLCHVDPGKPLRIGNRVTVGHGAILHGCTIDDDVLIGMGGAQ